MRLRMCSLIWAFALSPDETAHAQYDLNVHVSHSDHIAHAQSPGPLLSIESIFFA